MTNRDYVNTWSNEKLARAMAGSREICNEMGKCGPYANCVQCCLKWFEKERVPTEIHEDDVRKEERWIPCSERLPKKEKKTYWVCTDTEYQCECRWTNNRFGLGEGEWGWSIFDTPLYSKPIAWMPLPETYKAEEIVK